MFVLRVEALQIMGSLKPGGACLCSVAQSGQCAFKDMPDIFCVYFSIALRFIRDRNKNNAAKTKTL